MSSDASTEAGSKHPFTRASDIPREMVDWIWDGRLALGKFAILAGDPGVAKTTIAIDIAARVSRGLAMAEDDAGGRREPADALIVSVEDAAGDTIGPRLDAAGADVTRVHIYTRTEPLSLPGDTEILSREIERTHAVFLALDPLSGVLTIRNSWRVGDVRRALAPITRLAEQARVAILGIEHITKDPSKQAIHRVQGSIAFVAAARIALVAGHHPSQPDVRVLAVAKCNIAPTAPSLEYRVTPRDAMPFIEWLGTSTLTADEILALPSRREPARVGTALVAAADSLRAALKDGPVLASVMVRVTNEQGVSGPTLRRAKESLGVRSERRADKWWWLLCWQRLGVEPSEPTLSLSCEDGAVPCAEAPRAPCQCLVPARCARGADRCDGVVLTACWGDA